MKILIADNVQGIVDLMREFMKKKGHTVDAANNGKQALDMIKQNNYDLAFLDHNMPEMTGLEIIKYIKQNKISTKTVLFTGYTGMKDSFAKSLGADEYLSKPCELEDILTILIKYEQGVCDLKDNPVIDTVAQDVPVKNPLKADSSNSKKIMVVDDEPNIVRLIGGRLKANGYQVETAGNGKECLDKISDFKPDLIVLDVMMPVMDGYSTIIAMKEMKAVDDDFPDIPVLILSAKADEVIRQLIENESIKGYLTKPFKSDELLGKIKEVLG